MSGKGFLLNRNDFFVFYGHDNPDIIYFMIRKIVNKYRMDSMSEIEENLRHWLSRPSHERLAAIDYLRHQIYGDTERLQRVARVIKRSRS